MQHVSCLYACVAYDAKEIFRMLLTHIRNILRAMMSAHLFCRTSYHLKLLTRETSGLEQVQSAVST